MSFLLDYFDITDSKLETPVLCPFPHKTSGGLEYNESKPSASVNTTEKLFYCQACGRGYSEAQFIQKILGTTIANSERLKPCFETQEDIFEWDDETVLKETTRQKCNKFGISDEVIEELKIRTAPEQPDGIMFPVFMYNHLIDIRKYIPNGVPKVSSRYKSPAGLIIPYDIWNATPSNKITLICAGEKDMAVARSHGFNAITLTGGEQTDPIALEPFRDKKICIVYDNDDPGNQGAIKLANTLYDIAKSIKVCTNFHDGMLEKEDITDFFTKYGHTRQDLIECLKLTPYYTKQDIDQTKKYPTLTLSEASKPERINKLCKSNVQVTAISEATFACPKNILLKKLKLTGNNDTMTAGEIKEWQLLDDNCQDVLHLIDNNFNEEKIKEHLKNLANIPYKERRVSIKLLEQCTVYKAFVTDLFETSDTIAEQPMEYLCYAINTKLESGQKYTITHKLAPHPYKGNQLTMIIINAEQANDSISDFKITSTTKELLKTFQKPDDTSVKQHVSNIAEHIKGLLGYNGNNLLIETIDLSYHTPLKFNFGTNADVRAYLDTFIVGESRVGKSSTAQCLRKLYGLGTFTSLAGNSATIPGLVGGSNKSPAGYQTKAGIIPQNHKGLIIFEEFGKSNADVIKELTDIRSSNEVRVTRVAGTLTLPAMVRMITLTNPKTTKGQIKSIASYPNGIKIITELVAAAEDIARYDIILVLSDRGNTAFDPTWIPEEPYPEEAYRARIRWIWSRTPEQIIWSDNTEYYIQEKASKLNEIYDCHIKLFGTEAWKKLARIAVAMAGYVVSTDNTFENIIVKKEHVDAAADYMVSLYDNDTFKYKEYVTHERKYTQIDEDGIALLQSVYDKYPILVLQLEQSTEVTKNGLAAATGLETIELNKALNTLTKGLFITIANYDLIPTERFRLGVNKINRDTYTEKLGEEIC